MLPLGYLNVHLHEFCHALVATLTGGHAEHIEVFARGGGITPVAGGSLPAVAAAGYLGASIIGGLIIWFGRSERNAQRALRTLAILLGFSILLWVRADAVGFSAGVLWAVALWFAARLKGDQVIFAAQFVGIQQCLNSLQSVLILYKLSAYGETRSDAGILAEATGTSPLFWAITWCLTSAVIVGIALRHSWRKAS
jgi:hypothetical protein